MRYSVYLQFLFVLFFYDGSAEAEPNLIIKQIIIKKIYRKGKALHEQCTEMSHCDTHNAECIDDKCSCSANYKEVSGKCLEKIPLNSVCNRCDEDPGCADQHAECYDGICQCRQGYTEVDEACASDVVPEGEILGPCIPVTGNCTSAKTECIAGVCECRRLYVNVGPYCLQEKNYGEACSYSKECPVGMFCNCFVCTCKKGSVLTSEDTCEKIAVTGEPCSSSEQCNGTHTECTDNQCACQDEYGLSNVIPTNCVAKTTSFEYGPVSLDNQTLAYKEEYSDLNSTAYVNEAKPIIDNIMTIYADALIAGGMDVKKTEVESVENGTAGGSELMILFTVYNPEYDRPTQRSRRSPLNEPIFNVASKLNQQLLRRTRSVLTSFHEVYIGNVPHIRAVSQLGQLCDVSPDCDVNGGKCEDRACTCDTCI